MASSAMIRLPGAKRFPWIELPQAEGYRAEIDGLRAIAVLAVIVHHFSRSLLPSGYLGVDVFFVISGYVITASLTRRSRGKASELLIDFYSRRVRRLVPALLVCVVLTALMVSWFDPDPAVSLRTGVAALFGVSNLYLFRHSADYFGQPVELNPFTQTWSLGVEEQFYLVFPLLVIVSGFAVGRSWGLRALFGIVLASSIASLTIFVVLGDLNPVAGYYLMPARFWELGAGCLLFLGQMCWTQPWTWPPVSPWLALMVGAAAFCAPRIWSLPATVLAVLASVVLIGSVEPGRRVHRWLSHPWLVAIGVLSYSLYLWHWSVLCLSRWSFGITWWSAPLQLLLMLTLAWLSYQLVERPLRRRAWAPLRRQTIGLGMGACGAGSLLLLGLGWTHGRTADAGAGQGLQQGKALSSHPGRPTFLVVGNSHAEHLAPLFENLHRTLGLGVVLLGPGGNLYPPLRVTVPAYPFTRPMWELTDRITRDGVHRALPRLVQGDVVVLASKLEGVLTDDFFEEIYRARGLRTHRWDERWTTQLSADQAKHRWLDDVSRLGALLHRRGIRLVLVAPLPVFRGASDPLPLQACERSLRKLVLGRLQSNCVQTFSADRAELLARFAAIRSGMRNLEQRQPDLFVFDPFPVLCPEAQTHCTTLAAGQVRFRDSNHLSPAGALALRPDFVRFLTRHQILR